MKLGIKNAEDLVKEGNSVARGIICMLAYQLFSYDEKSGYDFIGILPERRKNPERITRESVLNWGRMILGSNADGKKIFFKSVTMDDMTGKTLKVNLPFNDYAHLKAPHNMIRMELRRMEKRDLFKLVEHPNMRWCNIGSRECAFFIQYKGLGFCVTELQGRGCSPGLELGERVGNKGVSRSLSISGEILLR